ILEVLKHSGLEDVIIVVTRYFGGTLLGTGGLVKAYTAGAKAAIEAAEILSYSLCVDLVIELEYTNYDRITSVCSSLGARIIDTQFTDRVTVKMRMLSGQEQPLIEEIALITKGKIPIVSERLLDIF
ncbi:MAG: YigZ family protein, partial [Oscillospiraceae bacterium]